MIRFILIFCISFSVFANKKLNLKDLGIPKSESVSFLERRTSTGETYKEFIKRDLIAYSLSIANFIKLLHEPRSSTLWPDEPYFKNIGKHLKEAFTKPPVWDKDPWANNYIAHPFNGALYYLSVREKGYTPGKSLAYANYKSLAWEYLIEGTIERPSIQDIIVTPLVGALWGEATYKITKKLKRGGFNTFEKVLVTIINPLHVIYHGYR